MAIFYQTSVDKEYIKVRWKEPYVSSALNRKIFGVVPKGVYSGFTIGPGGLSGRDIAVGPGSVSGGLGSGMQGGYVSGNFDESIGWSIAIHQNTSGYSTQVAIPPGGNSIVHLDATGTSGRVYIALDVTYALTQESSGSLQLVNAAQLDANPSMIVIGFVDIPASPSTPLDASMFGYNDTNYPRLTPLATAQKPGYMPTSVFSQLNQFFPWQNLLVMDRDPNNNYVIQISPSQGMASGKRIVTYILPSIASRFPRDASGNYNGGVNDDQLAKMNLQTGVISGAHQIADNLSFTTPTVVGTPSSFQVGSVCIDATDRIYVYYGSVYASKALALLDANLPIVSGKLFQVGNFLCETDGAGVLLPLSIDAIAWRRPFLNLGGGSGGDADSLLNRMLLIWDDSTYGFVRPYSFASEEDTDIDGSSTGSFDLISGTYGLDNGEQLISNQLLEDEFLADPSIIYQVDLRVFYDLATIDTGATYYMSIDGGVNYQSISMSRVGLTDEYYGTINFNVPALQSLDNYNVSNADGTIALDAGSGTSNSVAQPFTTTVTKVFRELEVYVNKTGTPGGSLVLTLREDNAGAPGDLIATSAIQAIADIGAGNQTVTLAFPDTVLPAGDYWLAVEPDDTYRASYVAATHQIAIRIDTSSPTIDDMSRYNGSAWSAYTGNAMCYFARGYNFDLRVKVVASATTKITGFSAEYGEMGTIAVNKLEQQTFTFTGDEYIFPVTNFLPNPHTLKVYWKGTGKVFVHPDFTIDGYNITFESGTFDTGNEEVLLFDQTQGCAIDTSDQNASRITALETYTPTVQKFTSGSGTYTTPSNVKWIRVRMVGGGGGGGGRGVGAGDGGTGGNTTFGSSLLTCAGGAGGKSGPNGSVGGAGGAATLSSPAVGLSFSGGNGAAGAPTTTTNTGGSGAGTPFAGGATSVGNAAGVNALSNSGAGGSGAGSTAASGGGGGAGAFIDAIITSPSASYSYAVGAGGIAGTGGSADGGVGGSGIIIVEEYYK